MEHQGGIELTHQDNSSEPAGTNPDSAAEGPGPYSEFSDSTPAGVDLAPDLGAGLNGSAASNGHLPAPPASDEPADLADPAEPADGAPDGPGVLAGARQRVGPAVLTVREKVGPAFSTAKDKIAPAVSTAKDKVAPAVSTAKERVGPAVSTAKEKAAPAVSTAKERVGPAVSTAKERVGPAVSTAKEKVGPAVATAREKVTPSVVAATERTRSAAGRVRTQAGEHPWVATAAERAAAVASSGKTARELGQEVRRHPAVAGGAGAALATGAVAVWLRLRGRRTSRD